MPELENGYQSLRPGKIASVVTYLEMRERPNLAAPPLPAGFEIRRMRGLTINEYRQVFRAIGENWLWFSRLVLPDKDLQTRLADPAMEVHFLLAQGKPGGVIELDRRQAREVEIVLFGIVPELRGRRLGLAMMKYACDAAWAHQLSRLWLHTCTLDDPRALGFYLRCGFKAYKRAVEVADDPRLNGILPRSAAPHVPLV